MPEIVQIGKRSAGFFSLIGKYCLGNLISRRPFHRLCTLMRKMNVKTVLIEDILPSLILDLENEVNALNTYYGQPIDVKTHRFTFLSVEVRNTEEIRSLKNENFLASALLVNFLDPDPAIGWRSYLYNAIVTEPKIIEHPKFGNLPLLNNYVHIQKTFDCEVGITQEEKRSFKIRGTFFCQQNGLTSVCAHAALCMTLNNFLDKPVAPEQINQRIGVNHAEKKLSSHPIDENELGKILEQYGLSVVLLDFLNNPEWEYDEYIYRFIESKFPVLLVFSTGGPAYHVVPILGHTLNSDMWRPEAVTGYLAPGSRLEQYKGASSWIDHFIIHDDNYGMYFCLLVDSLKRITLPKYDPSFRACYAIAIVPSGVTTFSWEAEWASIAVFEDMLSWFVKTSVPVDDWTVRLAEIPLYRVVRTFLVKKEDYRKSLDKEDFDGNVFSGEDKDELTKDLPEIFWLSEITLPDLYSANKHKIIDVFYGSDHPRLTDLKNIFKRWHQIRFPYKLIKRVENGDHELIPMSVKSHYPLLTFEKEQDVLEW